MAYPTGSQAETLSREKIDGWLQHLGASDKFEASKGIDWGVMPGPFYTPELGLGIGTAVVGMYRPDPQDTTSQNSTLTLSGYASSTGAFGLSVKNYAFSTTICGAYLLKGRWPIPRLTTGAGFSRRI